MPGRNPAGFLRRWLALVLDSLIVGVPLQFVLFFTALLAGQDLEKDEVQGGIYLVFLAIWATYFVALEGSSGATLGKRLMEIVVVDKRDQPIGTGQALARHLAAILNYVTLYIGYMAAAFTPRRQGLHDLLAGTVVVYREPGRVSTTHGCAIAAVIVFGGFIVLSILAAIAIPAYVDYSTRARVTQGLREVEALKAQLADHWLKSGELYDSPDEVPGYDRKARRVESADGIDIANGTIVLTFRDFGGTDHTLALEPVRTGDTVTWLCGRSKAPKNARRITNIRAAGRTTLADSVLPDECRR